MTYDYKALRELDAQRYKTIYARITSLTLDELPLEQIEGRITGGSINIDGNSAVRRTCQLSMVTDNIDITDYHWSLYTKFIVSIGVKNFKDNNIIWFNQGVYVITNFSLSRSTTSCAINISGKDKMCLLNGEIGGTLNSSVDFGQYDVEVGREEETNKPIFKTIKYPIKDIIREMVHTYANEPFYNIIINDLDDMGLELQEYRYNTPMYIWRKQGSYDYFGGSLIGEQKVEFNKEEKRLDELEEAGFIFDSLTDNFELMESSIATIGDFDCHIAKIEYGQTAGYKEIELVYPDELIANIGESITSVLDKIKNFLGTFEYFYNIEGQFVFQKKRTFVETNWSAIKEDSYVINEFDEDQYSYIFEDLSLFTTYNNTPNLNNLRNDFTVWGKRNSNIPVHMRYAIDKKPILYCSITVDEKDLNDYNKKYGLQLEPQQGKTYMASEGTMYGVAYELYGNNILRFEGIDYEEVDEASLKLIGIPRIEYTESKYNLFLELYDEIITCDWRELIYQMAKDYRKYNHLDNFEQKIIEANREYDLYQTGKTGYEQYYIDLEGFWRQLYAPKEEQLELYNYNEDGWNTAIWDAPNTLNFWFDFLDLTGELEQFSIPKIGLRSKAVSNDQVKAIYYKETPKIIFGQQGEKSGYRYFNAPFENMFSRSAQGKNAKEEIDNLLYNHGYCSESISITSIPIYYLEPNTKIHIKDKGDFIVNKLTIPLSYNGTMNITAIKAPERLL